MTVPVADVPAVCQFCHATLKRPTVAKCSECGEWLRWNARRLGQVLGAAVVVISLALAIKEMHDATRVRRLAATQDLDAMYREIDLYLVEHPEVSRIIAPAENFKLTNDLLATDTGRARLREMNFAAYVLDVLHTERYLKAQFDIEEFSDDDFLVPVLSNPLVAKWWNDPGLRGWYPLEFQSHVDSLLVRIQAASANRDTGVMPAGEKRGGR